MNTGALFAFTGGLFTVVNLGLYMTDEAAWWEVLVWLEHAHVEFLVSQLRAFSEKSKLGSGATRGTTP
jgi:hypothetical protein